jgi:hypothetical protein
MTTAQVRQRSSSFHPPVSPRMRLLLHQHGFIIKSTSTNQPLSQLSAMAQLRGQQSADTYSEVCTPLICCGRSCISQTLTDLCGTAVIMSDRLEPRDAKLSGFLAPTRSVTPRPERLTASRAGPPDGLFDDVVVHFGAFNMGSTATRGWARARQRTHCGLFFRRGCDRIISAISIIRVNGAARTCEDGVLAPL